MSIAMKDDAMLRRMLPNSATFAKAQSLLSIVRQKTAPGSGYDLRDGKTALAPICAFLACESTNCRDLSAEAAQAASFVTPKVFNATLSTIRAVLKQNTRLAPSVAPPPPIATFPALAQRYGGEDYVEEMQKVYDDFVFEMQNHNMYIEEVWERRRKLIICSVFWWTSKVLGLEVKSKALLLEQYQLRSHQFQEAIDTLDFYCAKTSAELRARQAEREEEEEGGSSSRPIAGPSNPRRSVVSSTTPFSRPSAPSSPSKNTRSALEKSKPTVPATSIDRDIPRTPTTRRINPAFPKSGSNASIHSSGGRNPVTPTTNRKRPVSDVDLDESDVPTPTRPRITSLKKPVASETPDSLQDVTPRKGKPGRPAGTPGRSKLPPPNFEVAPKSHRPRPVTSFLDRNFYHVSDERGEEKVKEWEVWRSQMGLIRC